MLKNKLVHVCDNCRKEIEINNSNKKAIELCSSCGSDYISKLLKEGNSMHVETVKN